MRKIIIVFLLVLGIIGSVSAETVLLYVHNTLETEEFFDLCLPVSMAVEDGVMNEFFDNGHIIFNAGIKMEHQFPEPPGAPDRLPLRIAKAGGASYLLEVEINYQPLNDEEPPESFFTDYVFSHVVSSRVLYSGEMNSSAVRGIEEENPEQFGYVLGKMIAQDALSVW